MVFCVALIGNIASGKSSVAKAFADLGVDVFHADHIARDLTQKNTTCYQQIVTHFGTKILNDEGEINRRQLRQLVFAEAKERLWLEQLLHPLIRQQIALSVSRSTTPYCLIEIPLLVDKTNYPYLNQILLVTCSKEPQIRRLIQRDKCNKAEALAIINTQPQNEDLLKIADACLINEGSLSKLNERVLTYHRKYLHLASAAGSNIKKV